MKRWLKSVIQSEAFYPSPVLGRVLNPFYFARASIDQAVRKYSSQFTGEVLDVGCGSRPYQKYFRCRKYVGMEISASMNRPEIKADVFYQGAEFPFENEQFDHVVSFQVLEHVKDPYLMVSEVARVLKRDGTALITVPFMWEEHEAPYDRTRFTSYGLKELFEKNNLEVKSFEKLSVGFEGVAQLFTGMIAVIISSLPWPIRYIIQIGFIFPIHVLATLAAVILPENDNFYLDNVILVRKR